MKHQSFQKLMGQNMKVLKKDFPNLPHTDIFKKAAEVTKKMYKPLIKTFKKGSKSKTRKGEKDFLTHKGDKVFHEKGKYVHKSREPYDKSFKVGKKGSKSKTRKGEKDFMTHKGDKVFHEKGKFVRKSPKPYTKKK